jgi:hypothetical protein
MPTISVAPIVEGHGDASAVRTLIQRIAAEFLGECVFDVLQPIRVPKSKITQDTVELFRAIDLAALKLASAMNQGLVLLMFDADSDAACELAPKLLGTVLRARSNLDFSCVIAVKEFETWLVGGAETMSDVLVPGFEASIPHDPERQGVGKGWIEEFINAAKYSESVDQVRLTARFDLRRARQRCPSLDKLCRELELRCAQP